MKSDITVRSASADDAYDFAYVLCESWKSAYNTILTPEELEKNTNTEKRAALLKQWIPSGYGQYFIAYDGEKPCGVCSVCPSRDGDMNGFGEVVAIYTLTEYWGKNIGKMLMDTAVKALEDQGFSDIMLWAFEENHRARRFYEKYGFIFDGTYKDSSFTDAKEVRYKLKRVQTI